MPRLAKALLTLVCALALRFPPAFVWASLLAILRRLRCPQLQLPGWQCVERVKVGAAAKFMNRSRRGRGQAGMRGEEEWVPGCGQRCVRM